jgi:hypothetical protein
LFSHNTLNITFCSVLSQPDITIKTRIYARQNVKYVVFTRLKNGLNRRFLTICQKNSLNTTFRKHGLGSIPNKSKAILSHYTKSRAWVLNGILIAFNIGLNRETEEFQPFFLLFTSVSLNLLKFLASEQNNFALTKRPVSLIIID